MTRLLREPLVQFGVLAVFLFVFFDTRGDGLRTPMPQDRIEVTETDAFRLIRQFEAVWKRAPTNDELEGLISAYLTEEVLVREALKLGLDRGDAAIRNRLRQKMLFLTESAAQTLQPDDAVLEQYLSANPEKFAAPARISFNQIYLGEAPGDAAVAQTRTALTSGQPPETLGERTLLPEHMAEATPSQVDRIFGAGFFAGIDAMDAGGWQGPVRSGYGVHLVQIDHKTTASQPDLADIRDKVLQDWRSAQSEALSKAQMTELMKRYEITQLDAGTLQELLTQ